MTTHDAAEFIRRAEERNEKRMAAIEPLAAVLAKRAALQKQIDDIQEQIDALDPEYGRAYVEAEKAGWDAAELAALDAPQPTRRPRGRPAKKAAVKPTPAKPAPATASEPSARDKVPPQNPVNAPAGAH